MIHILWIANILLHDEKSLDLMSWVVSSSGQASFQRSNSHDKVRKIVAEEGRTARNLIAWSVPLENKEEEGRLLHTNQTVHVFSSALAVGSHTQQLFVRQAAAMLSDKGKIAEQLHFENLVLVLDM